MRTFLLLFLLLICEEIRYIINQVTNAAYRSDRMGHAGYKGATCFLSYND